jgi:hypothetical protein
MLRYQPGWVVEPPLEATSAYSPSCSIRITGFLRSAPLRAPTDVITTIGRSLKVLASAPSVAS